MKTSHVKAAAILLCLAIACFSTSCSIRAPLAVHFPASRALASSRASPLFEVNDTLPELPPGSPDAVGRTILVLTIIGTFIIAVLLFGKFYHPREKRDKRRADRQPVADPIAILKEKLARGEISEDEFTRKKELLQA